MLEQADHSYLGLGNEITDEHYEILKAKKELLDRIFNSMTEDELEKDAALQIKAINSGNQKAFDMLENYRQKMNKKYPKLNIDN